LLLILTNIAVLLLPAMESLTRVPNNNNLEELPLDVHLNILSYLPLKDTVRSLLR